MSKELNQNPTREELWEIGRVIADNEAESGTFVEDHIQVEWSLRVKRICMFCHGTGLVPTDSDDGEGHTMRGTGEEQKCICQLEENDDDQGN